MTLIFSDDAWEDYLYWQYTDPKMLKRINMLIKEIRRTPYEGIGKPESLKHAFSGYWSRRINDEHLVVYGSSGFLGISTANTIQKPLWTTVIALSCCQ